MRQNVEEFWNVSRDDGGGVTAAAEQNFEKWRLSLLQNSKRRRRFHINLFKICEIFFVKTSDFFNS